MEGPDWVQVDLGEPVSIHAIVVWQILDTSQFTAFSHGQILNENNKVAKTDLVH